MVMHKKGDTLIEVMLAIGVFSMIAIAVTAVMSSGSSGAQTALETTLAREEIDTQAEAIRFIQASYSINKGSADDTYAKLWKDIIANPARAEAANLQYAPESCEDIYSSSISDHAFIINPRALSRFSTDGAASSDAFPQPAVIRMADNPGIFHQTSTYPRLVFGNSDTTNNLLNNSLGHDNLFAAEGLYVIAVKDNGTTNVVDAAGDEKNQGFYDFFIRSCWYGTDADRPTTISTVIRLYDPDAITTTGFVKVDYTDPVIQGGNPGTTYLGEGPTHREGRKVTLPRVKPVEGWTFKWVVDSVTGSSTYSTNYEFDGGATIINNETSGTISYTLKGVWSHTPYYINYQVHDNYPYAVASPVSDYRQVCYYDEPCVLSDGGSLVASGYKFRAWCKGTPSIVGLDGRCSGRSFDPGQDIGTHNAEFTSLFDRVEGQYVLNLKPVWSMFDKTYRVILDWGDTRDLDTHVVGQKSNGEPFESYFGKAAISERFAGLDDPVELAKLTSGDCTGIYGTSGCAQETFTLHTLGGKNYYYFVHAWRSDENFANATVTLQEENADGTWRTINTWAANSATGSGRFWNVFALKDGVVETRQRLSGGSTTAPYTSDDINY